MSNVTLRLVRGEAGNAASEAVYEVPYRDGMSLLDAIFWIREHVDPALAVRYSCRSANACKECSAIVDGKAGFLCSIRARPGSEVRIEPLSARPWIQDLVTSLE
ncbi:2Fe-2S iron-sulfur cluster-binding protein [Cohnella thermotolerans]|jgi:succinate dehydrogenase/fumarate reductase-like Fe-S protein|uniref:2Fe-2S iron-sulfur cluster-binding protein n=1 Tax=Cohnella thermotolerans TaxID=329858 RepID=UPI000404BEFD|nr:2Fe-2S iron-sulfur cluster-binding protein [Cohnella thermotolerans]